MLISGHNPIDSANIALEGAQKGGVAITEKEIKEIGDMLHAKGYPEEEILEWEKDWMDQLKIASGNPLPQPSYFVPKGFGGSGLSLALK
jgi:hypothetical protein